MDSQRHLCLPRGPGLNQRTVHGEMLVRHELVRSQVHFGKEPLRHIVGQQSFPVLGKHRVLPHRLVHPQARKPAEQQAVVDLFDQKDLGANRVKHLQ